MPQKDPSRTEKGTRKRTERARQDGSVPRSQELSKATVLLAGLVAMYIFISFIGAEMMSLFRTFFTTMLHYPMTPGSVYALVLELSKKLALMLLPSLLMMGLVAYITQRLQVGKLWTTKIFQPKFGKLFNIAAGLKKLMLSPQTLIKLGKSVIMALCIGLAPYLVLKKEMGLLSSLFYLEPHGVAAYLLNSGATMVIYALVPMFIIAAADVVWTRFEYGENLKMTKQEVKDERRQAEGDPKIKAEQKRKMLGVMAQRMLQQVPKADVVVTNPTHIAVALRYDALEAPAPVVLAKGLDHLAEKIKEVARENGVPIRENKPLAQALYKSVEIGESIPEELYKAVAQILSRLDRFRRG